MSEAAKDDASRKQDKQADETDVLSLTKECKRGKQSTSYTKSHASVATSRGKGVFNTGFGSTSASGLFVDIPLNSNQSKAEVSGDEEYEKISASDFSRGGQSYSAYNGQPDHVRKYPRGFGRKKDEE